MTNKPAVAVCDACVLYSITLADLLTSLGEAGLFRPRWTHEIHEEWIRNVIENRKGDGLVTREKLEIRRDAMIEAIENSLVEDYGDLIPSLTLPDADDRHVLAAAIKAEADLILTTNLKDFPLQALTVWNLTAKHPDNFTAELLDTDKEIVIAVVKEMRARRKRPPISAEDFLAQLKRQGLNNFTDKLKRLSAEI